MSDLLARRDAATGADLVELRLDGIADVDAAAALAGRAMPAVVTCRPVWEGGRYDGPERARLALLEAAVEAGAEFVDVEWRADRSALRRGARVVLSMHDFTGLPADLGRHVAAMRAAGAAIVKVAVKAARLADCVALRDAAAGGDRQVLIAMGAAGLITRVCPWLFGSCWTYAGAAAPGQVATAALRTVYRVGETSCGTRVFGVSGGWEAASARAAAHNAEFRARGLDAVSVPLAAADADDLQTAARAFDLAGLVAAGRLAEADLPEHASVDVDRWMGP
jgi:3-dehydroquinate dehydratase/shikimate dehydrogenase